MNLLSKLFLYLTVTITNDLERREKLEVMFIVYLDLSILSSGGQHLRVSTEAHTQHGIVHHHEVVLSLVLQILQDTIHTII